MSNEEDACIFLALALALKKNEKKIRKKRVWMNNWLAKRSEFTHEDLLSELRLSSPNDFRNCLLMNDSAYNELLNLVGPKIRKMDTNMRDAISVNQRLSITLRFLATGNTFMNLKLTSAISQHAIGRIVIETCEAIILMLKDYIEVPTTQDEWKNIADEFYQRWNFPNCLGALEGKHMALKKPPKTGSYFLNYKQFYSIVLVGLVNANYEFIMVDAGINGQVGDGSNEDILDYTRFGTALAENSLNLPDDALLPLSDKKMPFVFVGDDAYYLSNYVMTPYSQEELTEEQRIFNYRLNRARSIAENAFGILTARFGVLQRTSGLSPEKVQVIVLACCYLHNYLIRKATPQHYLDSVDREILNDGSTQWGSWRQIAEIASLENVQCRNSTETGQNIRDTFCDYFNNEGQVTWQHRFVNKE